MHIRWNAVKSRRLKRTRGASFEEIIEAKFIGVKDHPVRHAQGVLLFYYYGYVWVVPFVLEKDGIFLKTLFPSRNYTKKYEQGTL